MTVNMPRIGGVLALCATLVSGTSVLAAGRAAEAILKDYDAVVVPTADAAKGKTPAADIELRTKREKALNRRAELALELYRAHPENGQVAKLMAARWEHRLTDPKRLVDVNVEVEGVLSRSKNPALLTEASYTKAALALRRGARNADVAQTAIDDFIRRAPKDERGVTLLYNLATLAHGTDRHGKALARLADTYPDSAYAGEIRSIRAAATAKGSPDAAAGKAFELTFVDAITGAKVSTASLKGKILVIDFWATWCGPCVAEMPKMKRLYAEYKDKGVEFIGVSLDQPKEQGGLDKLKDFVASNGITWPQYYQGNGWESAFSKAWGINSIPAVFFVDANGKLVTTKARGQLETLIPEHLDRAKKVAGR